MNAVCSRGANQSSAARPDDEKNELLALIEHSKAAPCKTVESAAQCYQLFGFSEELGVLESLDAAATDLRLLHQLETAVREDLALSNEQRRYIDALHARLERRSRLG